ncbi:ankyrin repeat protein [Colletotrichum higginsianum]|nr:ankyrin repeat protein [Colletotrichum higginsianum]
MDPLSIAAFTLQMASIAGKIIEGTGKFVAEARAVRSNIDEFKDTISNLHAALHNVARTFKQHPHQLPFEREHHQDIYRILKSCKSSLDRLYAELPELAKDPGPLDKATASFVMTLRSNIHKEIRELTNAIRSANLLSRASIGHRRLLTEWDDDIETRVEDSVSVTKEIQAWRMSADEVAAAVTLQDADRRKSFLSFGPSFSKLSLDNDIGPSPATLGDVESDDWDPEPDHPDGPSKDILSHQYDANQEIVNRLVNCGIFLRASLYQKRGIEIREQLSRPGYDLEFSFAEQAAMKEKLADIILRSETEEGTLEAKTILQKLLQEEVKQPEEFRDVERRSRLYHDLGCLYIKLGNLKQAKTFLSRALEGRKTQDPMPVNLPCNLTELSMKHEGWKSG